jgi:hypothetical protein
VHWLDRARWRGRQDALRTDSWQVVHFIGHGDFDIERDEGALLRWVIPRAAGRLASCSSLGCRCRLRLLGIGSHVR